HSAVPPTLPCLDLRALPPAVQPVLCAQLARAHARQPFDLARGPLLRAALLQLDAQTHLLLLTFHHIVVDGWSLGVLLRELAACYAAARRHQPPALPPLPVQYADYALWQRAWLQGSGVRGQGSASQG